MQIVSASGQGFLRSALQLVYKKKLTWYAKLADF
jgi:hypothetical protein